MSQNNSENPVNFNYCNPPMNVMKIGKLGGINGSNMIESIFFTAVTFLLIRSIPFIPLLQYMLLVFLCGFVFFIFLRGIRGRSVCKITFLLILHFCKAKYYSFRPINKKNSFTSAEVSNVKKKTVHTFSQTFHLAVKERDYETLQKIFCTQVKNRFTKVKGKFITGKK